MLERNSINTAVLVGDFSTTITSRGQMVGRITGRGSLQAAITTRGQLVGSISGAKIGEEEYDTYMLVYADGTEVPAVFVENKVTFTATENDIRKGSIAATAKGVTEGTKVIPAYHTTEGYRLIPNGAEFACNAMPDLDKYNFTKLQVVIAPFADSIAGSVAVDKVAIDEGVYAVGSTTLLSTVSRDATTKTIRLNIINESGKLYLLRYFTYKEIA